MNSVEQAIEVAARAWHERLWNGIVEDAERTLELVERDELWKYFDDPAHAQEALEDARETLEFGGVPWETAEENTKEYARKQVRQTVLDALPAFLQFESNRAYEAAGRGGSGAQYFGIISGYLEGLGMEVKGESSD